VRVTYANCYLGDIIPRDVLVTDEVAVAHSAPAGIQTFMADSHFAPTAGEAHNLAAWRLAFQWFRDGDEDPTLVKGISAGDLGGAETAITVLLPAARGVLESSALVEEVEPRMFTTIVADGGPGHYDRVETVQADAAAATVRTRVQREVRCDRALARDRRNQRLFGKYAVTRDPDFLHPRPRWRRVIANGLFRAVNAAAALRERSGRPVLVVDEYNPTRAFARQYAAQSGGEYRLARSGPLPRDLRAIVRRGDLAVMPVPRPATLSDPGAVERLWRFAASRNELMSTRFTLAGVDLWPVLAPHLARVIERYSAFISHAEPACRAQLERLNPAAVIVPYDTPPETRLLIRVAQQMDIPTFVLNDGFKADDFEAECMTADHALAWSSALAEHYLARRAHGRTTVTGNPKADDQYPLAWRRRGAIKRILVGGFAFSCVDLNCRRSDPEWFLDGVLTGIECSTSATAQIVVKLHPADHRLHYAAVLAAHPKLSVELKLEGDVVEAFASADLYVTGASTSLLEAVAFGLPVIYYRVNEQHLHPPFTDDSVIQPRTAASPRQLAALIDRVAHGELTPETKEITAWCERYLGQRDGHSVARIIEAIRQEIPAA